MAENDPHILLPVDELTDACRQGHAKSGIAGERASTGARAGAGTAATLAFCILAGCSGTNVSADRAEIENMWRSNLVPKSSPVLMVASFDRHCVRGPQGAAAEASLRAVGYVPLGERVSGARAYVVDDTRPAVAISDTMCVVRAKSRTGQTDVFNTYVSGAFPQAAPMDPTPFGIAIEQAWSLPGPAIIAAERRRDIDFFVYTLIYYRPEAA